MTEFKKGDRVLVEGVVSRVTNLNVWVGSRGYSMPYPASEVKLAPGQPLKEGDQVITLAGSLGFIRAIYKDEAYVVLLNSPTRLSVTCPLDHLRRSDNVYLGV